MKARVIRTISLGIVLSLICFFSSCIYDEIATSNYPEQTIYIPASLNGIYKIMGLPEKTLADPTPGNTYSFTVDKANNKFVIPLSVYRSGIDNKGTISVNIQLNTDTLTQLIANDTVNFDGVEILPSDKCTFGSTQTIADGQELAKFDLKLDLEYLKSNSQKKYAIALSVMSTNCKTNYSYNTVIVLIDAGILFPQSDFSLIVDLINNKSVKFTSEASNAVIHHWDFGDGTVSAELNPIHIFPASGFYTISLMVEGISGEKATSTKKIEITN